MKRALARRMLVTSLVAAGAASSLSACSSSDPPLPKSNIEIAAVAPPPISGGTLLMTKSGFAVAADADRDRVWIVSPAGATVTSVVLHAGDEPGRLVEDRDGRVHVGLRGSGDVVTLDVAAAEVLDRTPVCPAPRGLAYDAASDVVHVACAGGELVTLPAAGGAAVRSLRLAERDLRDVIVQGSDLLVTRFRQAQMLVVDSKGKVVRRNVPPASSADNNTLGGVFTPTVAWRAIPFSGGVLLSHQLAQDSQVVISQPGGYGGGGDQMGGCDQTIVRSVLTPFSVAGLPSFASPSPTIVGATLPVDIAENDLGTVALVSAGADSIFFVNDVADMPSGLACMTPNQVKMPGQPVAVAFSSVFTPVGFVVQLREPAALIVTDGNQVLQTISLPGVSRADTGHTLFHHQASGKSFIACAGCHPEGHDDGHTWSFDTEGPRRTPTVSGGVLDTAPLHWDGDMSDLGDIMDEVFVRRMGGSAQGPQHVQAFADWLNTLPSYPPSPTGTEAQIASGRAIFERADVGCVHCHSGEHFTNNRNENVGTGAAFQVPPLLGVSARTPLMHDGCAATLADRLDPAKSSCNGGESHGHTAHLSASDRADLIAYLETL